MPPVTLPDRPDALRAVDEGRGTPIDMFVTNWEYTGSDPTLRAAWCSQLLDALESVRGRVTCAPLPGEAEVVARAIDPTGWLWYDRNAGIERPATQESRMIFRNAQIAYAERVLSSSTIAARDARMYRAGMEAMRERAVAAVKGERLHEKPDNDSDEAYNCAICHAAAAVRALPLDPTPASAMAGGGL